MAPPGGISSFSLDGMVSGEQPSPSEKLAAVRSIEAQVMAANQPPKSPSSSLRRYKATPTDSFDVGGGYSNDDVPSVVPKIGETIPPMQWQDSGGEELPRPPQSLSTMSSNVPRVARSPVRTGKPATSQALPSPSVAVGVLVLANNHGRAVKALVSNALSRTAATAEAEIYEVKDPLLLPFVAQRLLTQVGSLLVAAVVSSDGTGGAAMGQSITSALLQVGLLVGRPVYPGLLEVRDDLEARACLPPAVTSWTNGFQGMLEVAAVADSGARLIDCVSGGVHVAADGAANEATKTPTPVKKMIAREQETQAQMTLGPDVVELEALLKSFRASLRVHGAFGIFGIARKFRIADDDGNNVLSVDEFKKLVSEHELPWTPAQTQLVFNAFDKDQSGDIIFDEFLDGLRGDLTENRRQLVLKAFDLLDADKSGVLDVSDVKGKYNASRHPDVISGKCTEDQVLTAFLDTFNGSKDRKKGSVTPQDFCNYYKSVSACVDDDDYFELMIRNAWHMSGGSGWAANTSCRRVVVQHADGSATVEEIKDDLGIGEDDVDAMVANLRAQGIMDVVQIEVNNTKHVVTPLVEEAQSQAELRPAGEDEPVGPSPELPYLQHTGTKQVSRRRGSGPVDYEGPNKPTAFNPTEHAAKVGSTPIAGGPSPQRKSIKAKVNPQFVSSISTHHL